MAQLYINTVTATSFKWSIQGLGSAFTSSNYPSVGIARSYFTSGTTTRPDVLTYTEAYTGTTSTNTTTFYHGLSAGTYTLYGFAKSGNAYYSCGYVTITVPSSDSTPPTISNLYSSIPSHGYINSSTVTFSATIKDSGTGIKSVSCTFNGTEKSSTSGVNGEYTFSFNRPSSNGTYTVTWYARDKAGNLSSGKSASYWMAYDSVAPTISTTDIVSTGNTVKAGMSAIDNMSGLASITFKISIPNANSGFSQAKTYYFNNVTSTTTQYHSFSKGGNNAILSLGATYYVEITATDRLGNYQKKVLSIVHSYSKPSAWSWQTNELNAFNGNGEFAILTYQRWNSFCDYVLQLTAWYFNDSTDSYNVASAKVTSDNKTLTASKFNTIKNAIGAMQSTGISNVKSGDIVYGSYFVTLANCANKVTK